MLLQTASSSALKKTRACASKKFPLAPPAEQPDIAYLPLHIRWYVEGKAKALQSKGGAVEKDSWYRTTLSFTSCQRWMSKAFQPRETVRLSCLCWNRGPRTRPGKKQRETPRPVVGPGRPAAPPGPPHSPRHGRGWAPPAPVGHGARTSAYVPGQGGFGRRWFAPVACGEALARLRVRPCGEQAEGRARRGAGGEAGTQGRRGQGGRRDGDDVPGERRLRTGERARGGAHHVRSGALQRARAQPAHLQVRARLIHKAFRPAAPHGTGNTPADARKHPTPTNTGTTTFSSPRLACSRAASSCSKGGAWTRSSSSHSSS